MSFWRELRREVQTTFGRRRATGGAAGHTRVVHAPAGVHGLVVQEDESGSGWDLIERKAQEPPVVYTERCGEVSLASSQYLVGGEEGAADEEDAEYRRIWNLPLRRAGGSCSSASSRSQGNVQPPSAGASADLARASIGLRSSANGSLSPSVTEDAAAVMSPATAATAVPEAAAPSQLAIRQAPLANLPSLRAASCLSSTDPSSVSCAHEPTSAASIPVLEPLSPLPLPPSTVEMSAAGAAGGGEGGGAAVGAAAVVMPADGYAESAVCASATAGVPVGSGSSSTDRGSTGGGEPPLAAADKSSPVLGAQADACAFDAANQGVADGGQRGYSSWMLVVKLLRFLCVIVRWCGMFAVHFTLGLMQAHHPGLTLFHLLRNVHLRQCVFQCAMLNLLLFRGALHVYEKLLPALCLSVLGVRLMGDWRYELAIVVLWAAPAYVVCEIVTTSLHFKMAQKMVDDAQSPPPVGVQTARSSDPCDSAARSISHMGGVATAAPAACDRILMATANEGPSCGRSSRRGDDDVDSGSVHTTARGEDGQRDAMLSFTSIVYTRLIYLVFVLQIRLFCGVPFVGPVLTLVLSALLHAYDSFEFIWDQQGCGVAERFALIEMHWLYFLGYGGVLAFLSLHLRFWDLFVIRTVLYPIYIANAPHARFESRRASQPLPVFQLPLLVFNALLQLVAASLARS